MQEEYPELAIDGEMQVNFAMNRELRDAKYPFTRLKGKDVNTLIFPNLSSANAGYKLLQAMDPDTEFIGPIQMGLNKPIHFTDFESSVRDIVNITAVAVIDAIVDKKKKGKQMRRPLSKSQIVCISLLWLALCYLVLTKAERIDGMTVVMLVISAALVFIPVYKSIKKNK